MKPEIKQKWLEALRSGKYHQAVGQLKTTYGSFCCLGVLCDLHAKETGGKWDMEVSAEPYGQYKPAYCGKYGNLPESVREWADLQTLPLVPDFNKDGEADLISIAAINDRGPLTGHDFAHIADVIEQYL